MSVMKALDPPEVVYTKDGKKRATHEAYSYHITPYQNPPVKLEVVKGFIDRNGHFLALPTTARALDITPGEFRELISPTPQGKPAGDFRLSDVLGLIRRRTLPPPAPPADATTPEAEPEASVKSEAGGPVPSAGPSPEGEPSPAKEPEAPAELALEAKVSAAA